MGNLGSQTRHTKSSADIALTCSWLAPLYSVLGLVTQRRIRFTSKIWRKYISDYYTCYKYIEKYTDTHREEICILSPRPVTEDPAVLLYSLKPYSVSKGCILAPPKKIVNSSASDLNKDACSRPEALSYTQLKFQNGAKFLSSDRSDLSLGTPHSYSHQNLHATPGREVSWNKPSAGEGLHSYNTLRKKVLITRDLKFLSCC